jgi:hypothetical protein
VIAASVRSALDLQARSAGDLQVRQRLSKF